MGTNARKDKRMKERAKAGEQAIEDVARLQVENENLRKKLTIAMDELEGLRDMPGEIRELTVRINRLQQDLEQVHQISYDLNSEKLQRDTRIVELEKGIADRDRELKELHAADRDSAKLRRRLVEKQNTIEKLQTELSHYRREAASAL